MEIVELSADEVRAAADELAQLLLDAHASNMALGLRGPLTREHARETWLDTAGRLDPERRVLLVALEDGVVVGTVQVVRADAENGQHRAEIVRLAVRGDRRGGGIGKALLEAAAERARAAWPAGALALDACRHGVRPVLRSCRLVAARRAAALLGAAGRDARRVGVLLPRGVAAHKTAMQWG